MNPFVRFGRFLRYLTLIEWMVVFAAAGLLCAIVVPSYILAKEQSDPFLIAKAKVERQELYELWVKASRRDDITFQEWEKLKKNGMLGTVKIGEAE